MAQESKSAYAPEEVLKFLIKAQGDAAEQAKTTTKQNVDSLESMPDDERAKWMNIILGKTDDQVNFRKRLEQTIEGLHKIVAYKRLLKLKKRKELEKDENAENVENTENEKKESKDVIDNIEKKLDDADLPSVAATNAFVSKSLKLIHDLCDQNELVLVKNNVIPLLFELIVEEEELLDIRILSMSILNDITQNNPVLQNHIYALKGVSFLADGREIENGVRLMTRLIKTLLYDNSRHQSNPQLYNSKKYFQFRGKIWNFILQASHQHNPNLNVFLTEGGYTAIASLMQKAHQQSIIEDHMVEYVRVSRLINYILGEWSDCTAEVVKKLQFFPTFYWVIFNLHEYLVKRVNASIKKARAAAAMQTNNNNNNGNDNNSNSNATDVKKDHLDTNMIEDPFKLAQSVLDTMFFIIEGISSFMKRDSKCRRYVIIDQKDLIGELKKLNGHFENYVKEELAIIAKQKKENEQDDNNNNNNNNNNGTNGANGNGDEIDLDMDDLDPRVMLMQDICEQLGSILSINEKYWQVERTVRLLKKQQTKAKQDKQDKQDTEEANNGAVVETVDV